jgi:hypothetical protein
VRHGGSQSGRSTGSGRRSLQGHLAGWALLRLAAMCSQHSRSRRCPSPHQVAAIESTAFERNGA